MLQPLVFLNSKTAAEFNLYPIEQGQKSASVAQKLWALACKSIIGEKFPKLSQLI